MSKIVKLEAENVKRLKAVEITPHGDLVCIGGRNAQGKTSVLDAIAMALGGAKLCPPQPIRAGEDSAVARVELEDLIITRRFTAGGSRLTVEGRDGSVFRSPQATLDKLVGQLTFDPLEFSRLDPKAQHATLCRLAGLDISDLDAKRAKAYDERRMVNRDRDRLKAASQTMPYHEDTPDNPLDVSKLAEALRIAEELNGRHRAERERVTRLKESRDRGREKRAGLVQRLNDIQAEIDGVDTKLEELDAQIQEQEAKAAGLQDVDTADLAARIAGANEVNAKVAANHERSTKLDELAEVAAKSKELTQELERIDAEKAERIAAARFPLEALAVDEGAVLYQGVPLSQASAAEQLRVSVAIGLALNPQLRVMLVRDGSLLDDDSMNLLAEMARAADAQVWVERVGDGAECQVIIEDGEVAQRLAKSA